MNKSVRQFQDESVMGVGKDSQFVVSQMGSPSQPFAPEWEEQLAIFEAFYREVESTGAKLVVAARSTAEYRYLVESLRLRPIPGLITVDLQRVSNEHEAAFHFAKDGHWNERGHDKAGKGLFELIVMRHLLDGLVNCGVEALFQ